MTRLQKGDNAPDFELPNQDGAKVKLSDFRGSKFVVLFFYPKALTPGCTKQACAVRDTRREYDDLNSVVYGVSADPQKLLLKFIAKHELNFDLLSDHDHQVCEQYGVWEPKKFMGREYMGVTRATFIVGKDGTLAHIIPKVDPETHHDDVLGVLKTLNGAD